MSIGFVFWLLVIIRVIFGIIPEPTGARYWRLGGDLFVLILLILLGINDFGWPIHR